MPRSNKKPAREKAPPMPDLEHVAQAIYEAEFKGAYDSRVKQFPHMTRGLMELSRVSAALDHVGKMVADIQNEGGNPFICAEETGAPYVHPLQRLLKDLRSQQNRLVKSLNLSMEKKEVMRAETEVEVDDIMKRMS